MKRFALCLLALSAAPAWPGGLPVDPGPVFVPPLDAPSSSAASAAAGAAKASAAQSDRIATAVSEVALFCAALARAEYTVDCLAEGLASVARDVPGQGDYAPVRSVLADTAERLAALARANASPDLPRGRAEVPGGRTTSRPLTPVRGGSLAAVNAEASRLIAEAETILLRSAAAQPASEADFVRIAQAVGSTKLLLRS